MAPGSYSEQRTAPIVATVQPNGQMQTGHVANDRWDRASEAIPGPEFFKAAQSLTAVQRKGLSAKRFKVPRIFWPTLVGTAGRNEEPPRQLGLNSNKH